MVFDRREEKILLDFLSVGYICTKKTECQTSLNHLPFFLSKFTINDQFTAWTCFAAYVNHKTCFCKKFNLSIYKMTFGGKKIGLYFCSLKMKQNFDDCIECVLLLILHFFLRCHVSATHSHLSGLTLGVYVCAYACVSTH